MKKSNWYTLDNTAKLIPSITNNLNTNVFRLSCYLKEDIDEKILGEALDEALKEFPLFLYTMKNGIFWHYLEKSSIKPKVELEKTHPCACIDNGLLFRVSYYGKRINLEVYHVLADGNGAMEFLKFIVCTYLSIKYKIKTKRALNMSSNFEKSSDDFQKFEKHRFYLKIQNNLKAYKLKGQKKNDTVLDVIEVHICTEDIKRAAKNHNATVTIYLTAILIESIIENARIRDLSKPVGVAIPVDLRHVFKSNTSRNFFYTMLVQYKYGENHSLDDIIKKIKEQFELKLSKKGMQQMLDSYMTLQEILIIRLVPSFLKDIIMGYSAKIGKRGQTVALSNLGIVKIQEEYEEYIDSFAALASTEDMQLTVTSFKDKIVLGFTSHIINKEIERTMIELLKIDAGVSAKIYSNMGDAYEM